MSQTRWKRAASSIDSILPSQASTFLLLLCIYILYVLYLCGCPLASLLTTYSIEHWCLVLSRLGRPRRPSWSTRGLGSSAGPCSVVNRQDMGLGVEDHIPTAQMALRMHLDSRVVSMTKKTKSFPGRMRRTRRRLSSFPFKVNSARGKRKVRFPSAQVTSPPLPPSFGNFFCPLLNLPCLTCIKVRPGKQLLW